MGLYECRRYGKKNGEQWWMGALIICADSIDEATHIFKKREDETPKQVIELELKRGVVYDDEIR